MANANTDELQRVINHVFLPSRLPHSAENDENNSEIALIDATLQALHSLQALLPPDTIDNAVALITKLKAINSLPGGKTDALRLQDTLASLQAGQTLAVKVGAQNVAVLVTRTGEKLVFEAFELSPRNIDVYGTQGRLRRTFPGIAVAVSADLLGQSDFAETVANTLSTMCHQKAPGLQPTSRKAGAEHDENRDTASPALVSELFIGFLRGLESSTTPTAVSAVTKNMRDEVLWEDAEAPWRRSPMWTLIRVCLELVLSRSSGDSQIYKETMLYIMSRVLRSARHSSMGSDMLFIMTAKIQRRVQKLSASEHRLPVCVMASIQNSLSETSDTLATRWSQIQQRDARDLQIPSLLSLDFEQDTLLLLPNLDKHIEGIASRQRGKTTGKYTPSSELLKHSSGSLPPLPPSNSADRYYATANLDQFELWVARHIDQWVATKAQNNACEQLSGLMKRYYSLASAHYSKNPEMQSVMILTIYELWVACDKVAVRINPLLAEFNPGIPAAVLENLLLPFLDQMKRLSKLEKYLKDRRSKSTRPTSQLFAMSRGSFASNFFAQSKSHQDLLKKIVAEATEERQAKLKEFDGVFIEYRRLDDLFKEARHTYTTRIVDLWCVPPETELVHSDSCTKCFYERQRDSLSITVHEWPLPSDEVHAQIVVFELQVPSWFGYWRDLRSFFLQDVLKGERAQLRPSTTYQLSTNDPHLTNRHFRRSGDQRIGLLSQTKPQVSTHYKSKAIATLNNPAICVANGLKYEYYDSFTDTDMGTFTFKNTVAWACTYKLPCKAFQNFIFRPASAPDGPGPNTAIASQSVCPLDMALDEYKDLATISLGHHIQWANILLQLAMPGVDFKKLDTTLVFLQCLHQAGPEATNALREAHDFFSSDENAVALLQNLTVAFQRVKENWESAQAVRTFVAIAARALSLTSSSTAQNACLAFLKSARHVTIGWVGGLREKAYMAHDDDDRTVFISKSVEVALICISTFDVDDCHVASILSQDASILVQSSIVVQEGEQSQAGSQDQQLSLLDMRAKRLLHRIYRRLGQEHLHADLDDAIQKSWYSYVPGTTGWSTVSGSVDHWVTTTTAAAKDSEALCVHYNLLNGELLVNGLPLNQPPKSYREHSLYSTLFGQSVVEVMPCNHPGFQFSTKRAFGGGYTVQLGVISGHLTVKATKDGKVVETLPSHLTEGFPTHFERDYVHWLDFSSNTVQFRPADDPWNPSSTAAWTLSKHGKRWQLTRNGGHVAGVNTSTSLRVYNILRPLASSPAVIHQIVRSGDSTVLHIDIPSIRVGFLITQGTSVMRSREESSLCVDSDQSLGTLVGLESKLVLRPVSLMRPQTSNRKVLLPESTSVDYSQWGGHARVTINKSSISKVHTLEVDTQLGRLMARGNDIGCALYLAFLHATTSFCLIDPLTRKTGTEQALTMLNGAAVHSFDRLTSAQVDILHKLAELSPSRRFYPRHKRDMQTVGWNSSLSFLSQHGYFTTAVQALLKEAEATRVFYPDDKTQLRLESLACIDQQYLLERDNIRAATFRVSGYGAEAHTAKHDSPYQSRDHDLLSQRATKAAAMSSLMARDQSELSELPLGSGQLWKLFSTLDHVYSPNLAVDHRMVEFGAHTIQDGHDFVLARFPAFQRWLSSSKERPFTVALWLSTIASAAKLDDRVLQVIAMFFKSNSFAGVRGPNVKSFSPEAGTVCLPNELRQIITSNVVPFKNCPEFSLVRQVNERGQDYSNRREAAWRQASESTIVAFLNALVSQWPCSEPNVPSVDRQSTYINVGRAMHMIKPKFESWHNNSRLKEYFADIEQIVAKFRVRPIDLQRPSCNIGLPLSKSSVPGHLSVLDLFLQRPPPLPNNPHNLELREAQSRESRGHETPRLSPLMQILEKSLATSRFGKKYVDRLNESLAAMQDRSSAQSAPMVALDDILAYFNRCNDHVQALYDLLVAAVSPARADASSLHLPRVSSTFFLQQLAHNQWITLSAEWKACIVEYGLALTALQRAKRILKLMQAETPSLEDVASELLNPGHKNWSPFDYPESLLIEVESGIMIREVQEQIAAQMRDPPNGDNAVMQLNMGEGKSSVIVPITAAALASSTENRLVRVIVAKPQSKQMAQMLVSKLGGLLNRRVYYLPFSRSLKLDREAISVVCDMLFECRSNGGVLLVQPEHLLSFQLMGLESWINGHEDVGRQLLSTQTQRILDSARDIVDESDENFSVRFELIYTMGTQCPIELSPDRWLLLQQVLDFVRRLAPSISEELPGSLECHTGAVPGSFPRTRILNTNAKELLLQRLADTVCSNGLPGLQISRQPEATRRAVCRYISKLELSAVEIDAVESSVFWTETTKSPLLLLRGLIAGGVLAFTFGSKRWRVDYGLTTSPRTPPTKLAVPYRAKDNPSPRSEFSHPDVVITLTSLCYYYGGLSDSDLFAAMGHLMESDQSDVEYQEWVKDANALPAAFRQLQGINLKDRPQCMQEVFPALRYAKSTIDYFLSHLVFSKEMREFPEKLSASGWDLGKSKKLSGGAVTGFSGTNDSRCLLPIDIRQLDLYEQKHTNALVLEHILQPTNGVVSMLSAADVHLSDAENLLATTMNLDQPVQVILDVGAQILELDNLQVARTWLGKHDETKEAAVFIDDSDDICVVDRSGRVELLRTSSFSNRLGSCLIFLDEAHTRGIDLQLPRHYRAAVTLGAGLTKDRLVQACMRMRKLGQGQTVVFCVTQEIQTKILELTCRKLGRSAEITVTDVLQWSIAETYKDIRRSMPLWAVQGERFVRQEELWNRCKTQMTQAGAEQFQEKEAQSLDERYRPRATQSQPVHLANSSNARLQQIADRCEEFDGLQFNSSTPQEEQERELSPEIEQERQVQRPSDAQPAKHFLHEDVRQFVYFGVYSSNSQAYMPAFEALRDSSAAKDFQVAQLNDSSKLLVTKDFAETIQHIRHRAYVSDAFQRPVQWLLSTRAAGSNIIDRLLIISPFEANELYSKMTSSNAATLHVYKPRVNSGYASLDHLLFHTVPAQAPAPSTVPRALAVQLGLFAGQLYLTSYEDYLETCGFLGLSTTAVTQAMTQQGWQQDAVGFILRDDQGRVGGQSGLRKSPVNFFNVLMSTVRKNGESITKTHMGQLLEGKLFGEADF